MKRVILLFGLGIITATAFAQTKDSAAYSFSLQQSVDYAMQNQTSIKNAQIDEALAHQRVNEIRGIGLPQINGSFDVKDFLIVPTSVIPAEAFGGPPGYLSAVKFGVQYQATAGFEASQLLFSGDYFLGLQSSKVFLELSQRSTQRSKVDVAASVSKAYYTVLVNEERIKLMDANVTRLKKALDDTKALFDNGFVEKIDYDRLTVAYNNLLVEQEKVQRYLAVGSYLLKYQMGMNINAKLTLTDKLADVKFDAANISAQKFDYAKRVEYNLFETQQHLAQLNVKRQKLAYLPSAFAYGSFNGSAFRTEFDIFNTSKPWYPMALIGATVKVPIFSGLQQNARYQQSKLSLQKAQNDLEFMKQSIDLELAASATNLQNASSSLAIQKKNIETAEEVYRVTKIKFDQGVGSNLEMITAETTLKEAQTNYFSALFDALVAKIDFDKASGVLIK